MTDEHTPHPGDGKAILDLFEALGSSLDIRTVLERAYPLLLQMVPADYGALGISASGRSEDYEWIVSKIPLAFFAAYPEMAPHDFVRTAVASQPNVVLRDGEMVSRKDLESNLMYRRAREVGVPLEQVMAVMLHVDDRWQSGLALYRDKKRPFSDRERAALQRVTPALVNAVRSCHLFSAAADWGAALEALLLDRDASMVLATPTGIEVARTAGATRLLETWFTPCERRAGRVPEPLAAVLVQAARPAHGPTAPAKWSTSRDDVTLEASFVQLAGSTGKARWMISLQERSHVVALPPAWLPLLTPREQQVTSAALQGWDYRLIGEHLGCEVTTVKKHMSSICIKLGVASRVALVARAAELLRS
jgi:DNA-binding CsgD family transcriptional regulator